MTDSTNGIQYHSDSDDRDFIKDLFDTYYVDLVLFSMKYVNTRETAEEIVQDVFIKLWNSKDRYHIEKSIGGYLFTSVRNGSMNYLKSKLARIRFVELENIGPETSYVTVEEDITAAELNDLITRAINSLPPKCKIIFNLSRNAGLSYDEIASELHISRRTVGAQISIAIKKIKEYLNDWWENIPS
jgi:RNA polymerase sigma-70 factor (ECF subfamily)